MNDNIEGEQEYLCLTDPILLPNLRVAVLVCGFTTKMSDATVTLSPASPMPPYGPCPALIPSNLGNEAVSLQYPISPVQLARISRVPFKVPQLMWARTAAYSVCSLHLREFGYHMQPSGLRRP